MLYPEDIRKKSVSEKLMSKVYPVISAFTAANITEKKTKKLQVYSSFSKAEQKDGTHQYPFSKYIPEDPVPQTNSLKLRN